MNFPAKNLKGIEPARCVDGRPDPKSPQGPQMLGGSLHPLVINAIISKSHFDSSIVKTGLRKLKNLGFALGVHWGAHKHEDKSDCGFGDRLKDIIQTAKDNQKEILNRLQNIYSANSINADTLKTSYEHILSYNIENIKITGKELIELAIESGASVENLQGDHAEQTAFVNLSSNITLDTHNLNNQKKQAFNLDLWAAIHKSQSLIENSSIDLIKDLSLILYMATEMVLVEQKGKTPLLVILRK